MVLEFLAFLVFFLVAVIVCAVTIKFVFNWYRVVDTSTAHLVTNAHGMRVFTSDKNLIKNASESNAYFAIPEYIPFIGCKVRVMDLTVREITWEQIAYEKGQARFRVYGSLKYRINNVMKAAETFPHRQDLNSQLIEPIKSAVTAITPEYSVEELRTSKIEIQDKVKDLLDDDLEAWGITLVNFQLVDFSDIADSKIISDISRRTESEISAKTRQKIAEQDKLAREKEAEMEELASKREIEKETRIANERELMRQRIAEQEKTSKEKEADVLRVQTIQAAEITRKEASIKASQEKEVAEINKDKERQIAETAKIKAVLAAEADAKQVELAAAAEANSVKIKANAEAEAIKLRGLADAEAKEKLAEALKLFDANAINAMTAERQIEANENVGIATAEALKEADVKVFAGSEGKAGFDFSQMFEAVCSSSPNLGTAFAKRLATPNDLGVTITNK